MKKVWQIWLENNEKKLDMISFEKKKMGLENYSKEDKEYLETIWKLKKRDRSYLINEIRLETI